MDTFKVTVQGGAHEFMIAIPGRQTVAWLKEEVRLRAKKRGKDLIVVDFTTQGFLLDDSDAVDDVVTDQSRVVAHGPGCAADAFPLPRISEPVDDDRPKRKYARGGHKKLKMVAPILEAYLPEMMQTSEKERQPFYAKVASLPQMVEAEITRDEVVSWYKRARKKSRTDTDEDGPAHSSRGHSPDSLASSADSGQNCDEFGEYQEGGKTLRRSSDEFSVENIHHESGDFENDDLRDTLAVDFQAHSQVQADLLGF
jgi:hypothetical protein